MGLAEQDAITDVFVYGVPAKSGAPGESDVVAAVVPSEGMAFDQRTVDDIFAACRRGLEPNFVPSYLQCVAQIPKTASEKPQQRFLLEDFSAHAENIFEER